MISVLDKVLTVGVFSLSKTYSDELMWSHYAAAHQGYCIGFNMHYLNRSLKKFFYNVLEVAYSPHPPELKLMEQLNAKFAEFGIQQLIGTKSLNWKNEQEVRIVTDKPGKHFYDFRSVASIYFGLRMSDEWKDELMNALKGRGIKYFQMQMAKDAYRFTAHAVPDRYDKVPPYRYKISPVAENAIDLTQIQPHFAHHSDYLKKAVEVARREPYCVEVIMCGFSFSAPIDCPVIFVHCKRSDFDYGNFEYSLPEIDRLFGEIED